MAPDSHTDDEPDYSQLFVYAGPEQPDPSNMTVYAHDSFNFTPPSFRTDRTVPGQANIIGSSHYINLGGFPYPYRELTSCRPIDMVRDHFNPVVVHYDITNGISDTLIRTLGGNRIEIDVETHAYDPSADYSNFDLVYTFGPDEDGAPTAIRYTASGWETVHTYPEFDIELWTETTFFPVE